MISGPHFTHWTFNTLQRPRLDENRTLRMSKLEILLFYLNVWSYFRAPMILGKEAIHHITTTFIIQTLFFIFRYLCGSKVITKLCGEGNKWGTSQETVSGIKLFWYMLKSRKWWCFYGWGFEFHCFRVIKFSGMEKRTRYFAAARICLFNHFRRGQKLEYNFQLGTIYSNFWNYTPIFVPAENGV